MIEQLIVWFLRRFKLFCELERRVFLLDVGSGMTAAKGTSQRVEAEVHHALLTNVPAKFEVVMHSIKQSEQVPFGEIHCHLIEGAGREGDGHG
ncbi:MAG TPA: hypothetical protein VJN18_32345 [Polyangiaceae bacterium]|nr:hypothetical protein [Polyangiaceae bacterium]